MGHKITNAPLILKIWVIYFFLRANQFMGHFSGYFEGALTFLTPKLSLAQGPLKISREMAHKLICPQKKNNLPHFQNQRYINSYYSGVLASELNLPGRQQPRAHSAQLCPQCEEFS
jgi:hypothetical protein